MIDLNVVKEHYDDPYKQMKITKNIVKDVIIIKIKCIIVKGKKGVMLLLKGMCFTVKNQVDIFSHFNGIEPMTSWHTDTAKNTATDSTYKWLTILKRKQVYF